MPMFPTGLPPRPNLKVEQALWQGGVQRIAGIDEAGRGALAGPVAVGVLVLPPDGQLTTHLQGVRDSKQMSPKARVYWADEIKACALEWAVGFAQPSEIDCYGIVPAVHLATERALLSLTVPPEYLLIDYFTLPENDLPQTALVKGDNISLSIAGAAVLAKTTRDALMENLDQDFPGYGFAAHKGYGTFAHRTAIARLGTCAIHRTSFSVALPDDSTPDSPDKV
jgi:ribonuclease HII